MAIDTQNKRRSVIGYAGFAVCYPVPDGTVDATDRRAVGWLYAHVGNVLVVLLGGVKRLVRGRC